MLDIGFFELLLISIVALLVLGPEKLPQAVRTAALWIGRARRSFQKVKSEIEQQLNTDEVRRQLHNESILSDLEDAKKKAGRLTRETKESFSELGEEVNSTISGVSRKGNEPAAGSDKADAREDRKSAAESKSDAGINGEAESDGDEADAGTEAGAETHRGAKSDTDSEAGADSDSDSETEGGSTDGAEPEPGHDEEEKDKPVTDFYNNPPSRIVTVKAGEFYAPPSDENAADKADGDGDRKDSGSSGNAND